MMDDRIATAVLMIGLAVMPLACKKEQPASPPAASRPAQNNSEIRIVQAEAESPAVNAVATSATATSPARQGGVATSPATSQAATMPSTPRSIAAADAQVAITRQPFDISAWKDAQTRLLAAATQMAGELASDPRAAIIVGDQALARKDYTAARASFQRACDMAPTDLDALEGLAVTLVTIGDFEHVVPIYEKIIYLCPANSAGSPASQPAGPQALARRTAQFNLANAQARLGRLDQAVEIYQDVLAQYPQLIQARFNLATVYQAQNRLAKAADAWQEVIDAADKLAPVDAAGACCMRGQLLMDMGRPNEAVDAYVQATKFTPDDSVVWLNLSAAAQSAGSLGRAVAAIRQAINLTPRDADCYSRLGDVLLDVHQLRNDRQSLQDAVDAWQRSLDLNPSQPALVRQVQQYRKLLERTATSTPAPAKAS